MMNMYVVTLVTLENNVQRMKSGIVYANSAEEAIGRAVTVQEWPVLMKSAILCDDERGLKFHRLD